MVSNNIYTILPEMDGCIIMSTEDGITSFQIKDKNFSQSDQRAGTFVGMFLIRLPVHYAGMEVLFWGVRMVLLNFRKN